MAFDKNPVIIHGAGRSGTTLTLGILRANRAFYIPDELNFLLPRIMKTVWNDTKFLPYWLGQNRCRIQAFGCDWIDLLSDTLAEPRNNTPLINLLLQNNKHKDAEPLLTPFIQEEETRVSRLIGDFMLDLLIQDKENYVAWGFKEIWNGVPTSDNWPWDTYFKVFKQPKWVHVVRNPIDWIYSLAGNCEVERPSKEFIRQNLEYWVQINNRSLELTGGTSTLIKYEDLIKDPLETIQRLCEFIGMDYSDEMLIPMKHKFVQNKVIPQFPPVIDINLKDIEGFESLCNIFGYDCLAFTPHRKL